jgi:acetoin utilization deacetylase AcuC-like enzyme
MSYKVAATAAGACCAAVDRVMKGEAKNCFVACRPPGHHAGPSGLVHSEEGAPSESQGFCLLNNVAIAAAYAKYNYRCKFPASIFSR